jgi:C1A family cysteine protease
MPRKVAGYGWIPDLPDQRDHLYAAPPPVVSALPPSSDLRPDCPPVYDQGQLGSCTANAIGAAIEFDQMKQKLSDVFVPSRLYIYYNERSLEGTVASDSGAQIRDGIKTVASQGACHEQLWPYDITKFADRPPTNCYDDGAKNKAVTYQRVVSNPTQLKGCLASGYPFVFGFTVYESFESQQVASTGHAPMPASGEKVLGGHAVMAVGYDDASQWFLVRNSWGASWGMAGYFTLPYAYLTQRGLSSDFWTVRLVT